jgi:hypothetical protein
MKIINLTTEGAERRGKRRFQSRIPRYSAFSVVLFLDFASKGGCGKQK